MGPGNGNGIKLSRRVLLLSGVVAGLAAPRLWLAVRSSYKSPANTFELQFCGPFPKNQNIIQAPSENSWIQVPGLVITDHDVVQVQYGFKGELNPNRVMRVSVSAVASNGKIYTLVEGLRPDDRLIKPAWSGSTVRRIAPIGRESVPLPIKPGELHELKLCFEEVVGQRSEWY